MFNERRQRNRYPVAVLYFLLCKDNKHLGLEIKPALHGKLRYIAKYEDRSINGQVLYLIRQCVRDFEEKNGTIDFEET